MSNSVDKVNHHRSAAGEGVLDLVHTLMHSARSQQGQALRGGPLEMTHMESKVLGFFSRHPGATQSDLAAHSGRDKAQLARLIKGLRERDLLAAEEDAADRRNLRLCLTPAGLAAQRTLRSCSRQLEQQAVAGLSAAEQQQLLDLLRRVQANLGA